MYPALERATQIGSYAGLRPAGRDARARRELRDPDVSGRCPRLVHVAAIRSTGLSACLGIGEYVVDLLAREAGNRARTPCVRLPAPSRPVLPAGTRWWERAARTTRPPAPGRAAAMSSALLLGIDEGTTAVKAALFDGELSAVAEARRAVARHPPAARPGRAGSRADPRGGRGRGRRGARAGRRPRGGRGGPRPPGRVRARLGRRQRARAHAGDRLAGQAPGITARSDRGPARPASSAPGCRSIPTSRPASSHGCSTTTPACAALATRARCGWARSTPSSPTASAVASPPTSRRRRARSCSRSAGATGITSCCPRSACGVSGCRRSDRAFGSLGTLATAAGRRRCR